MASSSSNASSGGVASDVAKAKVEDVVDLCELAWSYNFGVSQFLWAAFSSWNLWGILSKGQCVSQERKQPRSQKPTRSLSSKSFLWQGYECHFIQLSQRFCSSFGYRFIT
jgi:hypothetical protein